MPSPLPLRAVLFLLTVLAVAGPARAQDRPSVAVYGFVRAEAFSDSRQVESPLSGQVEDQYGLFPLPGTYRTRTFTLGWAEHSAIGFSARQTRLGVRAGGAYAFGAEVSGAVEADFFSPFTPGPEFTLRSAFLKLDWGTHEVLAGQYWSPLFNVAVFPGTVAFNAGAPFQPYARQPQLRAVWKPGPVRVIAAVAAQQGEFADLRLAAPYSFVQSSGVVVSAPHPDPALANRAALPLGHFHLQYVRGESVLGAGVYGKAVRPIIGRERLYAGAVQGYAKLSTDRFVWATKGTFGTDLTDHLMTGGYVASTRNGRTDFDGLRVVSGWVDVGTRGHPFTFGLFGGLLANLGAAEPLGATYSFFPPGPFGAVGPSPDGTRAATLDVLWRAAPRVSYTSGPARIAAEVEVSTAYWRDGTDDQFAPTGGTDVATNVRGLLAFYYFF